MKKTNSDKDVCSTVPARNSRQIISVVITSDKLHKYKILERALVQSRFWQSLENRGKMLDKPPSSMKVVIKPDLELFDTESSTGTDPRLVEHLISLLYQKGYSQVIVADSIGSSDLWLENRDVEVLADLGGYRYKTDKGESYNVINLSNDLIEGGFEEDSVLKGSHLGREWVDADFRISMAKNKTNQELGFALGLYNILGVMPLRDKEYHYYHRLDPGDICVELLKSTPVHFSIIDAVVSNHGSNGSYKQNPLKTDTIIAGENIILCDFAGAMKMGLDPYYSPLNASVLRHYGLPVRFRIIGDLDVYPGWKNVPVVLSDSVRRRNKYLPAGQMARAWFQTVNKDIFPFRNYYDERINKTLTRLLNETDNHPLGIFTETTLNYFISWCHHLFRAYQVLYDKERIARKETSLGIDLAKYTAEDYSCTIDYLEPLALIASKTPSDHNGLKWRYLDHSVIFEYKKILPVDYDRFVKRVDISSAVRMMNDNIGGAHKVVKRDNKGRVILQAERNIYLPQPNWIAIFGGDFIDVGKLEFVRFDKNRQQIFWRTVTSANKSAVYDDGIVTFAALPDTGTEITVFARQEFVLPLLWQVFNIDYLPKVKDALISDSYTTFFSRTLANYEAAFEGRTTGIGKQWDKRAGEADNDKPHLPVEQLVDTALRLFETAQPFIRILRDSGRRATVNQTGTGDSTTRDDYQTFGPILNLIGETAKTFFSDLYEAVTRDINMYIQQSSKDKI